VSRPMSRRWPRGVLVIAVTMTLFKPAPRATFKASILGRGGSIMPAIRRRRDPSPPFPAHARRHFRSGDRPLRARAAPARHVAVLLEYRRAHIPLRPTAWPLQPVPQSSRITSGAPLTKASARRPMPERGCACAPSTRCIVVMRFCPNRKESPDPRQRLLQLGAPVSALRAATTSHLRGIADDLHERLPASSLRSSSRASLQTSARAAAARVRSVRGSKLRAHEELSVRAVSLAGYAPALAAGHPEPRHLVLRQGAGLVGADTVAQPRVSTAGACGSGHGA